MNTNNLRPYTSSFDNGILFFVVVSMIILFSYVYVRAEVVQKAIVHDKAMAATPAR